MNKLSLLTRQRIVHGAAALCMLITLTGGCQTASGTWLTRASFDFGLIGDMPYSERDATNAFANLLQDLNKSRLDFVVHDGDIKDGSSPCSDAILERRYDQFQTSRHPLLLIFGDNEWTDCGRNKAEPYEPTERLDKLRELFTKGDRTLGQRTLPLFRQSNDAAYRKYRENIRWIRGGVMFVGLNVPGSGNNYGASEFAVRNAANLAWMHDSFSTAKAMQSRAMMIIIQANPRFDLVRTNQARAGFNDFLDALEHETTHFPKPVVLVHGDSHTFRIDKPMISMKSGRRIENFTRVETFGYPDVHWIRVTADRRDPNVFTFRPQIVDRNLIPHLPLPLP